MAVYYKSPTFGNLLKGAINGIANYEGKTASIIEEELGALIGVSGKTIQRYKSGYLPPFDREHDAVRVLAEAAVRRGFLGREWLQRFLHAARYPAAEKLLDELCPAHASRPRPERIYENLPAPTYDQFVMRQQAFAEVVDGLHQRSAVVLIVGMGGNGKTSLAREVAFQCLQDEGHAPRFDAAVWVSDKDNPGTTNHGTVLDTIARVLGYPGFMQLAHDEKQYEIEQLLRRQKVLLIIDNAETITDGALFAWLPRLPEPSKAIITTREYHRLLRRNSTPVELRGMSEDEAHTLLQQRLERLRIAHLVRDQSQLEPLLMATDGNPKALTVVAGLLKYERRPLQQIIDDLYTARGDLFDDLFSRAWALLDTIGQRILMVLTFFPESASSDALSVTADVRGFDFDRAIERLSDLSLLDVQQADLMSEPRYMLHPLVRAFARAQLAKQPEFEKVARERWVQWYVRLTASVGFCWYDLNRLKLLNYEDISLRVVFEWARLNGYVVEMFQIALGIWYYLHTRGEWDYILNMARSCYELTRQSPKYINETFWSLAEILGILTRRRQIEQVEPYVSEAYDLSQHSDLLDGGISHALAWSSIGRYWHILGDTCRARQSFLNAIESVRDPSLPGYSLGQIYFAEFLYDHGFIDEAYILCQQALIHAQHIGYRRNIDYIKARLATIELEKDNVDEAEELLRTALSSARQYQDRGEIISIIKRAYARLYMLRGNLSAAHTALTEAVDIFERLGMRRELAEAREELVQLEGQMAAPAE